MGPLDAHALSRMAPNKERTALVFIGWSPGKHASKSRRDDRQQWLPNTNHSNLDEIKDLGAATGFPSAESGPLSDFRAFGALSWPPATVSPSTPSPAHRAARTGADVP